MSIVAGNAKVMSKPVCYLSDVDLKALIQRRAATKCCSRGGNRQSTHDFFVSLKEIPASCVRICAHCEITSRLTCALPMVDCSQQQWNSKLLTF